MNYQNDLETITRQEQIIRFSAFDEDVAWSIGSALRQRAKDRNLSIAAEIYVNGMSVFAIALPGSRPDNADWIRRKRNLVLRTHSSSYATQLRLDLVQTTLEHRSGLSSSDFVAAGGCFPIRVFSAGVIGALTISGLTSRNDHNLAVEIISAHLGHSEVPVLADD